MPDEQQSIRIITFLSQTRRPPGPGRRAKPAFFHSPRRRSSRLKRQTESPNRLPVASACDRRIRSRGRVEHPLGPTFPALRHRRVRQNNPPKRALLTSDSATAGVRLLHHQEALRRLLVTESVTLPPPRMRIVISQTRDSGVRSQACLRCRPAADGVLPMNIYHDISGWKLLFAMLTLGVVCDGFAVWMGWLSTH